MTSISFNGCQKPRIAKVLWILHYLYKENLRFLGVFVRRSITTGIERFEGVCVLAANRRRKLEKALSRRISMQVELPRPQTGTERLRICSAPLPSKHPLDPDVDLELLSHEDLAGAKSRT